MEEEKIIKFISGQLTPEEKEEVLIWISQSSANKEIYYQLKNLWALTIQSNPSQNNPQEELGIFLNNIRVKKNIILKRKISFLVKYAAIIFIAFLSGKFIFQDIKISNEKEVTFNEISVPPGQMAQLTLSDGTTVYINSCSRLKYPTSFSDSERKVYLSGEAFFSVNKGNSAFIVESDTRTVKVLGTQFNVRAYPQDKSYQTTLVEGNISLLDKQGNEIVTMKPNQQYSFDIQKGKQNVQTVKTALYHSWKNGIYVFDHEKLKDLAERLERIFAVSITLKNKKIENYKFTGTISRNVPFEQILKIIQISAPVQYKLKEINGTITEVILY